MTTVGSIFISGKEGELEDYRLTTIDVIESMNFTPVGSEFRTASPNPIEEEFLREVRNSDIYIGLFGLQFSQPTIREFETARENAKPVLIFEKELKHGENREPKLQEFLNTIKDPQRGVTVSRFQNVLELRTKVNAALSSYLLSTVNITEPTELPKVIDNENRVIEKDPKVITHPISISVKSDKSVYPPNATVHIRTFLNDIIRGKQIHVEIFNSNKKLLIHKKINPNVNKNIMKIEGYLYQISFHMTGQDWHIGEAYTIIVTHGLATSYDSFTVDRRNPIVQTDKSVYLTGSDIIVTVVDPDANRDSQKAETTGHKPNGKLVITSKSGQISGYKLIETGRDTGIFQGLIRVAPLYHKNKKVRPSGKGPTDGQIPVTRGELFHLSYSNGHGTALLTAYGSNFGATVSLDSKTYRWNDLITITVVAPDYNFNPEKRDSIGNRSDNKVTISTSIDSISMYKLVETSEDSGMFTGTLTIAGPGQKSPGIKKKGTWQKKSSGPNGGFLRAAAIDKITVTFEAEGITVNDSANIMEYREN